MIQKVCLSRGLARMQGLKEKQMNKYLGEKDVAEITGRALPTLRKDRLNGRGISYFKVGRQVRYLQRDVDAFMEGCRVTVKPLSMTEA